VPDEILTTDVRAILKFRPTPIDQQILSIAKLGKAFGAVSNYTKLENVFEIRSEYPLTGLVVLLLFKLIPINGDFPYPVRCRDRWNHTSVVDTLYGVSSHDVTYCGKVLGAQSYSPYWSINTTYSIKIEPIKLDDRIWYTHGIERVLSSMETMMLSGKNVARLIVDSLPEDSVWGYEQ